MRCQRTVSVVGDFEADVLIRTMSGLIARTDDRCPPAVTSRLSDGSPPEERDECGYRERGCYAYQIDGTTFSYLVVFEVRAA